jgi:hypothetical protein
MKVEITFKANIDREFFEELKRIVDHHLDYLVDFNSNPEIKSVYDAQVTEIKD